MSFEIIETFLVPAHILHSVFTENDKISAATMSTSKTSGKVGDEISLQDGKITGEVMECTASLIRWSIKESDWNDSCILEAKLKDMGTECELTLHFSNIPSSGKEGKQIDKDEMKVRWSDRFLKGINDRLGFCKKMVNEDTDED